MKHTKGPWTFHQNGDGSYSILGEKLSEKEYRWIAAFIQNGELLTGEQLANAKLMAAAPELADACYAVLQSWLARRSNAYKNEPYYMDQLREALKKAGV